MPTKYSTTAVNGASNPVALANAIRATASADYRKAIGIAENFSDVQSIGKIIMSYPGFQNEFLDALVNKVATTLVMSKLYKNPWAMFKKGEINLGETVEMVFADIIKARQYNITEAENKVYARGDANVKAAYATLNSRIFYKATVEPNQLARAFVTEMGMYNLVESIVAQLVNSREQDEFMAMKYLIGLHVLNGHFTPIEIPEVSKTNVADIATAIKETSNLLEFPSREYNVARVSTFTTKGDQYLISTAKFDATMDVNLLASAFNMDKAEFMGHRVTVDGFGRIDTERLDALFKGVEGYTTPSEEQLQALNALPAVLIDADWFMVMEQNLAGNTESIQNPEGLYRNYWRHVWMMYQANPFAPAVCFVPGAPSVTSVSTTSALTMSPGQTAQLVTTVETENFASKEVTYESDNENVVVDYRGMVYANASASGTANITVKSVADPSKTATCTITIA